MAKITFKNKRTFDHFPWRGQASSEFIDSLFETYASGTNILDPFCGSGTIPYQARLHGLSSSGADINPAAYLLTSRTLLLNIPKRQKNVLIQKARVLIEELCRKRFRTLDSLIDYKNMPKNLNVKIIVSLSVISGIGLTGEYSPEKIIQGFSKITRMLEGFPELDGQSRSLLCDARKLDILDKSIGTIVTCPPQISAYAYYQNYRSSVELLGWMPRESALAEIGSNSKYRQNGFLLVIQYCLDMQQALAEMSRVLEHTGRLVLSVPRTVTFLGATIYMGKLLRDLLTSESNFNIIDVKERICTDRSGELVHQDVIVAQNDNLKNMSFKTETTVMIGIDALTHALITPNSNAKPLLEEAIVKAYGVSASPLYQKNVPAGFI